jgi:hypothetical protein
MEMGVGTGVVKDPIGVYDKLPYQSLTNEKPKGVIDGGLGHRFTLLVGEGQYLVRGDVLRPSK